MEGRSTARPADRAGTGAALDRGARVLVATHALEPFVARAGRAVWFRDGRTRLVEPVASAEAEGLARRASFGASS